MTDMATICTKVGEIEGPLIELHGLAIILHEWTSAAVEACSDHERDHWAGLTHLGDSIISTSSELRRRWDAAWEAIPGGPGSEAPAVPPKATSFTDEFRAMRAQLAAIEAAAADTDPPATLLAAYAEWREARGQLRAVRRSIPAEQVSAASPQGRRALAKARRRCNEAMPILVRELAFALKVGDEDVFDLASDVFDHSP